MSDASRVIIKGTLYSIKDTEAREGLEKKLENIQVNGENQTIDNHTINLETLSSADVYYIFNEVE